MHKAEKLVTDHVPKSSTKRKPAVFTQTGYLAAVNYRVSIYRARAAQTGSRRPKLALATGRKVWRTSRAVSKDLAFLPRNTKFTKTFFQLDIVTDKF